MTSFCGCYEFSSASFDNAGKVIVDIKRFLGYRYMQLGYHQSTWCLACSESVFHNSVKLLELYEDHNGVLFQLTRTTFNL